MTPQTESQLSCNTLYPTLTFKSVFFFFEPPLPAYSVSSAVQMQGAELECLLPRVNAQLSKSLLLCSRWHFVLTRRTAGQVQSSGRHLEEVKKTCFLQPMNCSEIPHCSGVYTLFSKSRWNAL